MHSRIEPEPFIACISEGLWALALWRPDAPDDRLETEAGFVLAPRLDLFVRVFLAKSFDGQF
jgi:hypothetical protein